MKSLFWHLRSWWRRLRGRGPLRRAAWVEDVPSILERDRIYLVGESAHRWCAAFFCPCGCGEIVHLSMLEGARPRWSFKAHCDGTLTFHPSIDRIVGCRSHFWIRGGDVVWAGAPASQGSLALSADINPHFKTRV